MKTGIKDERVWKCLKLIDEFSTISHDSNHPEYNLFSSINWHKFYETIGCYLTARFEGRYLRQSVCNGGYEGLEYFHKLKPTFSKRSKEFCKMAKQLCRTEFTFMQK
jgi:hypothetical protein